MNPRRALTLFLFSVALAALAACATPSSSGSSSESASRSSGSPRVRCLSDPKRDDATGTRPLFYFMCVESP